MLLGLALVVLAFALVYGVLCLATFDKSLLPKYIRERLHEDWGLWPFTRIPRRWTSWVLYMPPHRMAGNASEEWIPVQTGYPLAPDCKTKLEAGKLWVLSMHPVHPAGQWSLQGVRLFWWLPFRVPCYITMSRMLWGRRLHMNFGIKPDVTTGDWHFGFPEASITAIKINA